MVEKEAQGLPWAARLGAKLWLEAKLRQDRPKTGGRPRVPRIWPTDRIKIGAVQWNAEPVKRARDWSERVAAVFRQAAHAHCHLLVFPEYLPLSLLGAIMPDSAAVNTLTNPTIRSLLRIMSPSLFRHWRGWMAALSREFSLVTIAGSGLTLYHGQLINVALGFGADGRLNLWQPKWHPLPVETQWGIVKGPETRPAIVKPWGLSALVCNDATYFESFRMVESMGARLVAVPIADADARYTPGKARRGCFSRVQDVPMVGIVAASTGRLFGLRLTGKAGIYVPSELTPDGSGIVAESCHAVGEELITGVVSLSQLTRFQEEHRIRFPVPAPSFVESLYQFEEEP